MPDELENKQQEEEQQQPQEEIKNEDVAKKVSEPEETQPDKDDSKVEVDTESIKADVEKSVLSRIQEAFGLNKKEAKEKMDNEPDIQSMVNKQVQEALAKRDKEQQEQQKKSQEEYNSQVKSITNNWYKEYDALVSQGKAPKIQNPNDKNDPGIKARRALIQTIGDIIKNDQANGISNRTPSVFEAFTVNPRATKGVAGADLPISGQSQNSPDTSFKQAEVAKKSFEDIMMESI